MRFKTGFLHLEMKHMRFTLELEVFGWIRKRIMIEVARDFGITRT